MSVLKLLDDANTQIFEWLDLLEHGGSVSSTLLPSPVAQMRSKVRGR